MLACSTGFSTNFFGILCAFLAALVFVTQNIFSKKLFNEASRGESEGGRKLDKLNLLCYCSGLAFILTMPIWFLSEGYPMISDLVREGAITLSGKQGALDHGALLLEFVFNGIFHFAQNILAFVLLSMISPVSYSVASLIKRVFIIVVTIIWFGNPTTRIQAFGIALTVLGLYLYDRNNHDDMADRRANADHFRNKDSVLPLNASSINKPWDSNAYTFPPPTVMGGNQPDGPWGYTSPSIGDQKKDDKPSRICPRGSSVAKPWLPPGTRQESTWQPGDLQTPE
jgi:solute carrier family 35 protein E1